jgi:hypothetical protein
MITVELLMRILMDPRLSDEKCQERVSVHTYVRLSCQQVGRTDTFQVSFTA